VISNISTIGQSLAVNVKLLIKNLPQWKFSYTAWRWLTESQNVYMYMAFIPLQVRASNKLKKQDWIIFILNSKTLNLLLSIKDTTSDQENMCTPENKPGKLIQNKLYIILTISETMWYAFNNTTERYVRHMST
jgi:hypothetical protein